MTRVARLFLALALLLAPILHPAAMAAPGPSAVSAHHCSGADDGDGDRGGAGPSHGTGIHASCPGTGACDLQTILTRAVPADRAASLFRDVPIGALIGLDLSPDPSPPRVSF
ncbi:MAG: hypothetical protein IT564_01090 [Rhodospirillales bacterium]|nr:hypothetical protein [Rhodospirillales bacterium]